MYSARKPFHPKRLFNLIHDKFIVIQNVDDVNDEDDEENNEDEDGDEDELMTDCSEDVDEDEDYDEGDEKMGDDLSDKNFSTGIDPQVILANKRNDPALASLLRSKGFSWLATRPYQIGEWSQAGGMLTLGGGGPWFCTVERGK